MQSEGLNLYIQILFEFLIFCLTEAVVLSTVFWYVESTLSIDIFDIKLLFLKESSFQPTFGRLLCE